MTKMRRKYEVTQPMGSQRKRIIMAEKLKTLKKVTKQKDGLGLLMRQNVISVKNQQRRASGSGSLKQSQKSPMEVSRTVSSESSASETSENESSYSSGAEVGTKGATGGLQNDTTSSESSDEEMVTEPTVSLNSNKNTKSSGKVRTPSYCDKIKKKKKSKRLSVDVSKDNESGEDSSPSPEDSTDDESLPKSDGMASEVVGENSATARSSEETAGEDEYDAIRKEIANMPFDELEKLKERVGSKVYNQALFGKGGQDGKKRIFKRANKNRPMEMSSKAPVPRYRQMQMKKARLHRDPRFDDLSGAYNENLFKRSYAFLDDLKSKEKVTLQKKLKKERDPDKAFQMKKLINRMTQQEKTAKEKEKRLEQAREIKKKEKEFVGEGKAPFYLKKSEKKKLELAEKFKELKKSGKLEKYLNRKRKKIASKDRRRLPNVHSR